MTKPTTADLAARTQRFERCRPKTSTECIIEAQAIRPLFQAEVRRYRWQRDVDPTAFEIDAYYLELALNPRPEGAVNFLDSKRQEAFVATGNCSLIPANQKTVMRIAHGEQLVIGCIFDDAVFAPYVDWQWTPLELAACMNMHNHHIQNALLQLSQELLHPGPHSAQWLDALFNYLLVELSRHIRNARQPKISAAGTLSSHQLRLLDSCIHSADNAFPQTRWLAQQLAISPRHLARLFKNTTGQTISAYVNEARINRAKTLLLNSRKPIKEIAINCGFKTASAFTQVFRTATGSTPKQFRANTD